MIYLYILSAAVLLVFVMFSLCAAANEAAGRQRLVKAAEDGSKCAALAVKLRENTHRIRAALLLGKAVSASAFCACTDAMVVSAGLEHVGVDALLAAFAVLLAAVSVSHGIGKACPEGVLKAFAYPVYAFSILLSPIVLPAAALSRAMEKRASTEEDEIDVTDEELVNILETIEDEGVFTEKEGELIRSAIEFSDVTAIDIYMPRVDVCAVDLAKDVREILADEELLSYSRIPAYRDSIDNIVGILSTKKLIKAAVLQPIEEIRMEDMLTEAVFVHKTRNISSILSEFRKKRCQMAIVIDEFGGTMGILTLEDILEEIVGEIFDESDEIELDVEKLDDGSYIVDGAVMIEEFFDFIGYTPPEDFETEYDTVGGWAAEMLDRFPAAGDSFSYDVLEVRVESAEAMRVEKLRVRVEEKDEEED